MDQPTEEERLGFAKSYGVEPVTDINTDLTFKDAGTAVAEMTPIIGDAMAAKEIYDELQKEDPDYRFIAVLGGAALIGAVPGIGDVAAKGIRNAADMIKRIEVDPDALGSLGGNIRLKPKETGRGLVRDVDDLVDTWARGDISNKELRDSAKELGVEINTKRITKNKNSSDIEITMPDGNIYTGVDTIPDEVVDPEYVKGLTKPAETDALQELGLTDEALEAWKKENYAKDKFRVKRLEKLEDAAKALREGEITSGEFRELADAYMPIVPIEEMPNFPTKEEVVQALHATDKRKVAKGIVGVNKTIKDGTPISARLDIPAYNDTDTWVVSLHDGTTKNGDTVGYAQTAVLNDVNFTTNPLAASAIAAGNVKTTIARMNGSYVNANPEEVYSTAKELLEGNPKDWTQVGMNPNRASYFYDKADGMPVTSAEQVIQVGPLVFAHKVKKTTPDDEMFQFTNKRTGVTANFSEGGMALEEQMAMNFGDVPDNTIGQDPVSGNDIPLGSTAENVRDDIPTMLSEGEIVVPADVVNFHGVKLFEDLRTEAKLGYAQMANDGRIGGEPMDDTPDMDMDISLTLEDLETSDDMEPVQMRRGGMNVERGRGSIYSSYSAPKKAKPTRDRSMSAVVKRAQANKGKPKNRFEAIRERLKEVFRDDDRRPTLTKKPPKSDPIRPSIAQQINFGGDYKDKEPPKPEPKKRKSSVRGAGDVTQAYRGEDEPLNVRYYDQPFYKRLMEGLGVEFKEEPLGFDDGGLIGGEDQFNQPFYAEGQKGGFDMENAYADYGEGTGEGPLLEMREYMNDAGHRIFITFIDGVPQMEIPAGYYPVEEGSTVVATTPAIGGSGGSDMGDPGSGIDMPTPTPVNYKELSMEELTQMVEDQKKMTGNAIAAGIGVLNPIVGAAAKLAMWNETRQLKNEIQRRRDDPATSEVDKRRYDRLLEIANAEEPGLIATLLGKITGNDPTATEAGGLDYDQLDKMTKAYTPEDQQADIKNNRGFTPGVDDAITPASPAATAQTIKTPGVDTDRRFTPDNIAEPAAKASTVVPKTATEQLQDLADELTTPQVRGNTRLERDAQRRRDRQEANKNITGSTARKTGVAKSATRGLGTTDKKGGAELDSRFGITGLHKGALVDKPKVKKVVKGLKKASKTHAKQADQLEKAMKKKSK